MNTSSSIRPPAGAEHETRAVVIDAFGGPELLRTTVRQLPPPSASDVQLQVAATAVNPVDLTTRAGRNIPFATQNTTPTERLVFSRWKSFHP